MCFLVSFIWWLLSDTMSFWWVILWLCVDCMFAPDNGPDYSRYADNDDED